MSDSDVLIGFAVRIEKRNDGRIDPINTSIAGTIAKLPFLYLTGSDCRPQVAYEVRRVITGVDNAVVLTEQLFTRVFRDTAKLVVDESNDSRLIGDRHDR